MIRAVIFDMDGLLIDTEPVWRRAEMDVFGRLGLHLTEEQCLETTGVRIAEVVDIWYRRHPWAGPTPAEVAREIEDEVIRHVTEEGEAKPGVYAAMRIVREAALPAAIASSSSVQLIQAVMKRLNIERYVRVTISADDEVRGKPAPDVYLTASRELGVVPSECLALEDSPNGVRAAKAAGMLCFAVPDPNLADDPGIRLADFCLGSLLELSSAVLQRLGARGSA